MTPRAKRLLLYVSLVLLGQSLSGLFVQAYMFEQGGDLGALSRFNFAVFVASSLAFLVLGPLVKRGRAIVAVRIGLLLQVFFFLAVLALGSQAGNYLSLLGAASGLAVGSFWVGQNILMQRSTTEPEARARFWGYHSACVSATALIGPFTGSRLVAGLGHGLGYQVLFGLALLCYAAAAILTAGVQAEPSSQPYRLLDGLRDDRPGRPWWRTLGAHATFGFRDGLLSFLPSILVYIATGDAKAMGNLSLITSAIGLVTATLVGRKLGRQRWLAAILLSGLIQGLAAFAMLLELSFTTLLLYMIVVAFCSPFLNVPFITHTFDTIGSTGPDLEVERIVVRECFLVVGRAGGTLFLLLMNGWAASQESAAMITLSVVAATAVAPGLILGKSVGTQRRVLSKAG